MTEHYATSNTTGSAIAICHHGLLPVIHDPGSLWRFISLHRTDDADQTGLRDTHAMALHTGSSQPLRVPHSNPLMGLANPAVGDDVALPEIALHDDPVPADVAYQLIKDELLLDGSARLNLATFVTTWMEPQALTLMKESADKNMIDKDEYPQTAEIERRCVAILADLWHAPSPDDATGCSTTGSSEACMLAGMALKRRWEKKVREAGGRLRTAANRIW